jgi:hypothetical protein
MLKLKKISLVIIAMSTIEKKLGTMMYLIHVSIQNIHFSVVRLYIWTHQNENQQHILQKVPKLP